MRRVVYKHVLRPSVAYLAKCGRLMLDLAGMAEFLGVASKVMPQLVYSDRIPLPCELGLGKCHRWSVLELLAWVAADCPPRTEWIALRGSSGRCPRWRW